LFPVPWLAKGAGMLFSWFFFLLRRLLGLLGLVGFFSTIVLHKNVLIYP
jgi:hypothetical protein